MLNKLASTAAVVLAASQIVSAQTHTDCDPRKKSCPNDPAVGIENPINIDFTKGENDFMKAADGTTLKYGSKGAEFTINKATDAPTAISTKYIFFGRVDLDVLVAPGAGLVTSLVLESDDLDEIDYEWIGNDFENVQTNYFGKGDDSTFDRGGYSPAANAQTELHTYTIDWTKERIEWSVDGAVVRTLKYADAKGGSRYPQTPCRVKIGTWDAGAPDSPDGTAEWAGGRTDFDDAPFVAYYKSLKVVDYANGVKGAKEYEWKSGSDGSYQSIIVKTSGGDESGDDETTTTSATKTTSVSKTTTAKATTTAVTTTANDHSGSSTLATITSSGAGSSTAAPSTTDGSSSGSPTSAGYSGSGTATPTPTGAAFKNGFSGALVGAGLLAALAF